MADKSEEHGDVNDCQKVASSHEEEDSGDEEIEATDSEGEEDEGEEQDEDDEPKLKYARLTSSLGPVYKNGDATSAFMVAGDKMVRQKSKLWKSC